MNSKDVLLAAVIGAQGLKGAVKAISTWSPSGRSISITSPAP
jgi:hypothetical protein